MAVKASILENQNIVTVNGLYQWDYGQVLEIECMELGSEIMEIHFACRGMSEAIVRSCSFTNGVGNVTIPDQCLEQSESITAWIYSISGTQGRTIKTITLPITARIRPSTSRDVPAEYINLYGEALEEINEAVEKIESGDVTAAKAKHAVSADNANTANSAVSASFATSAGSANTANTATQASSLDMVLVETISMENGTATISEGVYNMVGGKLCLIIIQYTHMNSTDTGIAYLPFDRSSFISVGKHYLHIRASDGNVDLYTTKDGAKSENFAKLFFYVIGTV